MLQGIKQGAGPQMLIDESVSGDLSLDVIIGL